MIKYDKEVASTCFQCERLKKQTIRKTTRVLAYAINDIMLFSIRFSKGAIF